MITIYLKLSDAIVEPDKPTLQYRVNTPYGEVVVMIPQNEVYKLKAISSGKQAMKNAEKLKI